MKSPFAKTLIMAVIALISSAAAASFYPWPEPVVVSDVVGKPLFESYDTNSVRSIRITQYNDERNGLDRMVLRRSGEKWIIPEKKKFVATNSSQIAIAANSLIDREVLDETTDEQQAYFEFGVVDPAEYQNTPNRSGLGTKIELENRNGQELASLIVGKQLKDDPSQKKHFVRVPGQPNVYVIDFDPQALSTDFRSWVDANLFQLGATRPVHEIVVENYRIDPANLGNAKPALNYRATLVVTQQGGALKSMESGGADGSWNSVEPTAEMAREMQVVLNQIIAIQFSDVRRKPDELARLFKSPKPDTSPTVFESLKPLGLMYTGFENGSYEFQSVGGEVTAATEDGVVVTMYIGSLADKADAEDMQLSYFAMLVAGVDPSIIPEPTEPEPADDSEQAERENKAYLRLVEQRKEKLQAARVRASELNQQHAEWVYIVPEDVIEMIRPDVAVASKPSGIGDVLRIDPESKSSTAENSESK